mmetsp:Transcript_111852/g.311303  ORF Transcript_111852/g.311303 Transcript_111852/m.311303 type:complete len:102 (+) Transcript_111852:692-997(+)
MCVSTGPPSRQAYRLFLRACSILAVCFAASAALGGVGARAGLPALRVCGVVVGEVLAGERAGEGDEPASPGPREPEAGLERVTRELAVRRAEAVLRVHLAV